MDQKQIKSSIIIVVIIIGGLMLMMAIGYTVGILSEDPDGLERTLIDAQSEEWIEDLPSPWDPILGWIENDYIAGIVGVLLSFVIIITIFYGLILIDKRKRNSEKEI